MQIKNKHLSITLIAIVAIASSLATWWLFDPKEWWQNYTKPQKWAVPVKTSIAPSTPQTKLPPTEIEFPTLKKNLVVSAGVINDGDWDLYDDKVAWLATSAVPGEGNVILYAHNRRHLFGNLNQLKPGDKISVTQGKTKIIYKVRESRNILPTDVNAILSPENQLTLYTCDGSFDQKRLVVYADPI